LTAVGGILDLTSGTVQFDVGACKTCGLEIKYGGNGHPFSTDEILPILRLSKLKRFGNGEIANFDCRNRL